MFEHRHIATRYLPLRGNIAALLLAILFVVPAIQAQDQEPEARLAEINRQIEELKAENEQLSSEIDAKEDEISELRERIKELDKQLEEAKKEQAS